MCVVLPSHLSSSPEPSGTFHPWPLGNSLMRTRMALPFLLRTCFLCRAVACCCVGCTQHHLEEAFTLEAEWAVGTEFQLDTICTAREMTSLWFLGPLGQWPLIFFPVAQILPLSLFTFSLSMLVYALQTSLCYSLCGVLGVAGSNFMCSIHSFYSVLYVSITFTMRKLYTKNYIYEIWDPILL